MRSRVVVGGMIDRACDRCLARSWLLSRLAGHLDLARARIEVVLGLEGEDLIAAIGGKHGPELGREYSALDIIATRERLESSGTDQVCRCDPEYPQALSRLCSPPAVLYVAGGLERFLALVAGDPVAIVGARQASSYGNEMAHFLGRGLASAGITVLSGMAIGIDSASHAGALAVAGPTVAVLAAGAERPYPRSKSELYRQIATSGAVVSELGPGSSPRRWMFPARNRIIAALSAMTIVVEAGERSGALLTAKFASSLGRVVGAVPGRVNSPLASGPNRLIADGARLVSGPQDVLDHLFGIDAPRAPCLDRIELEPPLQRLFDAVAGGSDTLAALARAGFPPQCSLGSLAALELAGYVRREAGGRYVVLA